MIIKWYSQSNSSINDITDFIGNICWGGSSNQAARTLSISVAYSPFDKNIMNPNIKLGDRLMLFTDDNSLLIDIMVYYRERNGEAGTITYSGYDDLNYLLRSNITKNFKNCTPDQITTIVCNELKIGIGSLALTKVNIKSMLSRSEAGYNVIIKAYTKAHNSDGKMYMPIMFGKRLYVIEKGEIIQNFVLNDRINITSSNYSESLESMINKVKLYDDHDKLLGEVKNSEWISSYGIFQDNYSKEDGVNANIAAKNMLTGIEKTVSLEAIGNVKCISGYGIKIKDTITGLLGKFWIENDTHTWENGNYIMSLELSFKNIMELEDE